jgi:hypothetical protein
LTLADPGGRGFGRMTALLDAAGGEFASLAVVAPRAATGSTEGACAGTIAGAGGDGGATGIACGRAPPPFPEDGRQAKAQIPTTTTTPAIAVTVAILAAERNDLGAATDSVCACGASLAAEARSSGHLRDIGATGGTDSLAPSARGSVPC